MYCWKCGAELSEAPSFCSKCGVHSVAPHGASTQPTTRIEDDPALRMLLPVGRSGLAIAAGYMGLFALVLVPAPFAILLGILALRDIKNNPKKMGKGRAIFGIIMGILGTAGLVYVIISSMTSKNI